MTLITLTTDFGTRDGYVGAMKGVIARLAPGATVIDLAHDVPRHDVAHAAWVLASAAFEFPPGTIHVAVVDPGVGGDRAEVVVSAAGHRFVGPDNGLFALVGREADGAWSITALGFRSRDVCATFHGRDVFAPAAAALARGLTPDQAGAALALAGRLPWPPPPAGAGAIVHVDVYGNLISDLAVAGWAAPAWARRVPPPSRVHVDGHEVPLVRTYEDVAVGAICAYVGSMATLEIAVREGSAAERLRIGRGAEVRAS